MPQEFRYFMLINETETVTDDIFPYIKDSNGTTLLWDGSIGDPKTSVRSGTNGGESWSLSKGRLCLTYESAQSYTYDLSMLDGPKSGTLLILGGCMKDSASPASDTHNKWTYSDTAQNTVYGIYHKDDKSFMVYPSQDAAAPQLNQQSLNGPAMANFLVALGGLLSPEDLEEEAIDGEGNLQRSCLKVVFNYRGHSLLSSEVSVLNGGF